jgi:hypothetical protein
MPKQLLKAEFKTPETGEAYVWQNCRNQRSIVGTRNYVGTAIEKLAAGIPNLTHNLS